MHKYIGIVDTGTGLDWMGLGVQPSATDATSAAQAASVRCGPGRRPGRSGIDPRLEKPAFIPYD